jgi:hypothetical protein
VAKKGRSWLEVDRRGRRSSKGGGLWHPDSRFNRIYRILKPSRYTFFFGSPTKKNSGLRVLSPEQFQDGWPTGKSFRMRTSKDKVGLVCRASLWFYVAVRSNDWQARSDWSVTNMVLEPTLTVSRMRTGQGRGYVCMTRGSVGRDMVWYVCC